MSWSAQSVSSLVSTISSCPSNFPTLARKSWTMGSISALRVPILSRYFREICWLIIDTRSANWPFCFTDVIEWFGYLQFKCWMILKNIHFSWRQFSRIQRSKAKSISWFSLQSWSFLLLQVLSTWCILLNSLTVFSMWQDSCFCWLLHLAFCSRFSFTWQSPRGWIFARGIWRIIFLMDRGLASTVQCFYSANILGFTTCFSKQFNQLIGFTR